MDADDELRARLAVLADPADDLPRLAYADFLTATGEPWAAAWADEIVREVDLWRAPGRRRTIALGDIGAESVIALAAARGGYAAWAPPGCAAVPRAGARAALCRGFVGVLNLTAGQFFPHAHEWGRLFPLEGLRLVGFDFPTRRGRQYLTVLAKGVHPASWRGPGAALPYAVFPFLESYARKDVFSGDRTNFHYPDDDALEADLSRALVHVARAAANAHFGYDLPVWGRGRLRADLALIYRDRALFEALLNGGWG